MSKISFNFDHMPSYFRCKGWFKPKKDGSHIKRLLFISWAFSRCRASEHKIFHDNKEIILKPYQFIFGRSTCVEETGLTEDEVRAQQLSMEKGGFLKKAPNKTPNRFTIYEWLTEAFSESNPQQNPQQTPNKPPTNPHNTDIQISDKVVNVCDLFVRAGEEKEDNNMNIQLIVVRHRTQNSISIRKDELVKQLKNGENPCTDQEIEDAIICLQEQNPVISGTIQAYILGIIKKIRKIQAMELKYVNGNRTTNQQDLVRRSRESFTKASVYVDGKEI